MSLKLQILMALLSCAAVRAQCTEDGLDLEDGQVKCTSCLGYTSCVGEDATPTVCPAGTTCFQDGDNTLCVTPASHECVTCPAGALTACDPFDPYLVVACIPGQAPVLVETCDFADEEICQDGACVPGTTPAPGSGGGTPEDQCANAPGAADATVTEIITSKPDCTSGLVCSEGVTLRSINCTEGEYFDLNANSCLSLPVDNCVGVADGEKAPYRTDCTKYVTCKGGEQVADYDCPSGEEFDVTGACLSPDTPGAVCAADLVDCTFESDGSGGSSETTSGPDETTTAESGGSETTISSSTTTTKPEECTADNVNQRYPVEGDCKSFWVCRKTSSDSYAYIKSQCSGNLVYNPETTYCDLPENVPGC